MHMTREQLAAAAAELPRLYIEAGPGSGKTVVAASRFGVMRFGSLKDRRGVAALSFTRSATAELRQRVVRRWGTTSVSPPNRISTIDALFADMLRFSLADGVVEWPNSHVDLQVRDDWSTVQETRLSDRLSELTVLGKKVVVRESQLKESVRQIKSETYRELIHAGHCTHEDVRNVMRSVFGQYDLRERLGSWLANNYKALVIDEVFDANDLDLDLISLASGRGIPVALIGDPWQALYEFRGARPDLVPKRLAGLGFTRIDLTRSFRFAETQRSGTERARAGKPVELEFGEATDVDVVLCTRWSPLLDGERGILPLALGGTKSPAWALATLALDAVAFATIGSHAIDVATALRRLGLEEKMDPVALRLLHGSTLSALREGSPEAATKAAWSSIIEWVVLHGGVRKQPNRRRQQLLSMRKILLQISAPTVGLSVHQAKGLEWERVGLLLQEGESEALARGLSKDSESERKLYVALTRAKVQTLIV